MRRQLQTIQHLNELDAKTATNNTLFKRIWYEDIYKQDNWVPRNKTLFKRYCGSSLLTSTYNIIRSLNWLNCKQISDVFKGWMFDRNNFWLSYFFNNETVLDNFSAQLIPHNNRNQTSTTSDSDNIRYFNKYTWPLFKKKVLKLTN